MENNKKSLQEQITPKLDAISRSVYDQLKKNDFVRIVYDKENEFLAKPMNALAYGSLDPIAIYSIRKDDLYDKKLDVDNLYNKLATLDYIKKDIIDHVAIYDKFRKK